MKIEPQPGNYRDAACDLLAFPVFEDETGAGSPFETLDRQTQGVARSLLEMGEFRPELHTTSVIHRPQGLVARSLLLVGAGKRSSDFNPARLRELAGTAVRKARQLKATKMVFVIPRSVPIRESCRVAAEGAFHGNYESGVYKTRDKKTCDVEHVLLATEEKVSRRDAEAGIQRGMIIGTATNIARTLVDEPANVLTPSQFAERAVREGGEAGLEVEVLERKDMEKLGMNTILAVSRGSHEPPKLLILRIPGQTRTSKSRAPYFGFVGKGVTFDSGGISLKPGEKMEEMKADMAGGAAVLGALLALARLKPRRPVVGLIPLVENLPGGSATKPGDVVKTYLGKTVEIINTDAEGRLIMADALAYARTLGANRLIDIATLTGACVIALVNVRAGMMGTDQETIQRLRCSSGATGEKFWELPLDPEYRKALDSDLADLKNVGPRGAGAITAAKFLQEFAEDTPWVHLDIAGVDLETEGKPFAAKGATGFGVRTLVQLLV
jgi:leucyl aminopeptidase